MAYRILAGERSAEAMRRIASEQVESALQDIDDDRMDLHETVHEIRKRCKKIRGLIRLFRLRFPCYSAENAAFRDMARHLSDLRDAAALVETCDALSDRFAIGGEGECLDALRETLVKRRDAAADSSDSRDRIASVREALEAARRRVADWSLEAEGFDAIAGGWKKVHRRARKGMRRALQEPSVERLHEWRKRVKYYRYQLRLLRDGWPLVLGPLRDSAKLLSDRLGDDHDLAVLRQVVVDEPDGFEARVRDVALHLIDRRRNELQLWSFPEARRLLDESPARVKRRMRRVWEAWHAEQQLESALPDRARRVS